MAVPANYPGLRVTEKKVRRGELKYALLELLKSDLCTVGQQFDRRGWVPATSANFSARLDANSLLVTSSGAHKGELFADDLLRVDLSGRSLVGNSRGRPSAETGLHTMLYRKSADIRSVLHTHSPAATLLSLKHEELQFSGYEVQKGLQGVDSHHAQLTLPVFDNSQDIAALSEVISAALTDDVQVPGFLIRGHGLYAWGSSIEAARRHVETLEFLCECTLLDARSSL